MSKESFLFVPYHAGPKKSSDARSHAAAVSRQRRDNSRLKTQAALQRPVTLRLAPFESTKVEDVSEDGDSDGRSKRSDTSSLSPPLRRGDVSLARGQRRQHMRAMQFSWRAGNVSAEFKISAALPLNQFGFSSLNGYGQSVVDYYKQVISPVNHPVYTIFNVTNVYTSYWMQLLQSEDYKPAGLAMVGAVMQRVIRPTSEPSEDVKLNQATAIRRLQKRYNEALKTGRSVADEMTIITCLALASLAKFLGDLRGYETHKNSMKAMVASRGGLEALGHNGLARCTLLQWDSFWVFETQGTPLFSDSRPEHIAVYPAFPLSADVRETFLKLPAGFQALVVKGKISVELIEVLGRAADATASGLDSLASGSMFHSQTRKYSDFIEACPCLASTSDASLLEKEICLALLLYCSNAFTTARSFAALYASYRRELSRMLLEADTANLCVQERECLFWVCAICVDSWRQNGSKSSLLSQGVELVPALQKIRDTLTAENVLQRFFTYPDLLSGCPRYLSMAS